MEKVDMRKVIGVMLGVALSCVFGVSTALARGAPDTGVLRIPFSFVAANETLPPGNYLVEARVRNQHEVVVENLDRTSLRALVPTLRAGKDLPASSRVNVRFLAFDGQYYLVLVAVPGEHTRAVDFSQEMPDQILAGLNVMMPHPGGGRTVAR
jgi:hypothetical protein